MRRNKEHGQKRQLILPPPPGQKCSRPIPVILLLPHGALSCGEARPCGSGGIAEKIFDIIFPTSVSAEIRRSPHPPGLEDAGRVCLLERDREAGLPGVEQAYISPTPRRGDLGISLGHSVDSSAKPFHGFLPPTPERFDGERNQATPWQRPGGVAAVFPVCCPGSGGPIRIGGRVEPSAALRVSDNNIAVDQGVVRRTEEAAVQARLFDDTLAPRVGPRPGPRGLQHLGGGHIACGPPNPSESIPERVVTADDQTADPACQRVEAVSIQRLRALSTLAAGGSLLSRVSAALVAAAGPRAPAAEGDAEPQA